MREVLEAYPGAQRALFRGYHIGGCSSCAFHSEETLDQLCLRNDNLDVEQVIAHIVRSHDEDQQLLIAPAELAGSMKRGDARLVDIRTREEWEAARIEGARFFTQELLQEMLSKWPRGELLAIYDHQGTKSQDAAAYFQGQGFQNVKSLRGGIDAWSQEVDPKIPRYRLE